MTLRYFPLLTQFSCHSYENREVTASSVDYAMLQMSAIRKTKDLNAFHRSPGVHGLEVSNVSQLHVIQSRKQVLFLANLR